MAESHLTTGNPANGAKMKIRLITPAILLMCAPLNAATIEKACNGSNRTASNETCSCIQKVANVTLSNRDQKQAAKFFKNPQLAQDTRQSDNPSKERFWLRYKEFGLLAEENCSTF